METYRNHRIDIVVLTVNISLHKGTAKEPVPAIEIDTEGVIGDTHRGTAGRNVSLLDRELIDDLTSASGIERIPDGGMGENITCRISGKNIPQVGDRIRINDVLMHVEKIGKDCHGDGCAIFRRLGKCVMPSAGIFCSVIRGGKIEPGMIGELIREI